MIDLRKFITEETQSDFSKLLYAIHARSSDGGFSMLMDDDFDFNFLKDLAPRLNTTLLCGYESEDLFGGYLSQKRILNENINPIIYKLLTCFFDEMDFEIDAFSGDSTGTSNYFLEKYYRNPNDAALQSIAEDISRWFDVDIQNEKYIPFDEENLDEAYGGACIIRFSKKCDSELINNLMEFMPFANTGDNTWSSYTLGDYEGYSFSINIDLWEFSNKLLKLLETIPPKENNDVTHNVDRFINVLDIHREDYQMGMGNEQLIEDIIQSFCSEMEVIL